MANRTTAALLTPAPRASWSAVERAPAIGLRRRYAAIAASLEDRLAAEAFNRLRNVGPKVRPVDAWSPSTSPLTPRPREQIPHHLIHSSLPSNQLIQSRRSALTRCADQRYIFVNRVIQRLVRLESNRSSRAGGQDGHARA